jgi:DNA-binding MarR family transcriptional regulator
MSTRKRRASGAALHDFFRALFALHEALTEAMDEVHEKTGLRTSQRKVGRAIAWLGPASVPQIAATLKVSRQFVQTVCDELEEAGLVALSENPRHKRSKLMSLSEAGRRALARAEAAEAAIIEKTLPNVNAASLASASALLEEMQDRLRRRQP